MGKPAIATRICAFSRAVGSGRAFSPCCEARGSPLWRPACDGRLSPGSSASSASRASSAIRSMSGLSGKASPRRSPNAKKNRLCSKSVHFSPSVSTRAVSTASPPTSSADRKPKQVAQVLLQIAVAAVLDVVPPDSIVRRLRQA